MSNVWILPPSVDDPGASTRGGDGDYLLRRDGEDVTIWLVDDGDPEWIAEVPASELPEATHGRLDADEPVQLDDPHEVLVALRGITEAVRTRGA